jgi:hypothetical protein
MSPALSNNTFIACDHHLAIFGTYAQIAAPNCHRPTPHHIKIITKKQHSPVAIGAFFRPGDYQKNAYI